ncbi:MAG: hypothetical protein AB8H80_16135 [Planctomycetota bacterium]
MKKLATNALLSAGLAALSLHPAAQSPVSAPVDEPSSAAPEASGTTVCGMLLDEDYAPASGVPIWTRGSKDIDFRNRIKKPLTTSGEDGRFEVVVAVDEARTTYLMIGGRRHAILQHSVKASQDGAFDLGTLVLARGISVTGRVRMADGSEPVGAVATGTDLLATARFLSYSRRHSGKLLSTAEVRPNGFFLLPGMVRSAGRVEIRCPGFYDAVVRPVAVGDPIDVTMHPAPTVRGRVVDKDGAPLVNQRVYCGSARGKTGDDGTFAMQLRTPHTREIWTSATLDSKYRRIARQLDEADMSAEVELKFEQSQSAALSQKHLVVAAQTADGSSVSSFTATACWHQTNQLQFLTTAALLAEAAKDKDRHKSTTSGSVTLAGPRQTHNESALVCVRSPGHGWGMLKLDQADLGNKQHVVTLTAPVAARGKVLDEQTGKAVAGVTIVPMGKISDQLLQWLEGGLMEFGDGIRSPDAVSTDESGAFALADLPADELTLLACLDGRRIGKAFTLDLRDGKPPAAIEWKIPNRRTLSAKIQLPDIPGLRVRLHRHRKNTHISTWARETEGAIPVNTDGSFVFRDIAPRLYRPEILLPQAGRIGRPNKIPCELWDHKSVGEAYDPKLPDVVTVQGRVGGDVPWNRLCVLALQIERDLFYHQFAPPCFVSVCRPDRTYRMPVARTDRRFALVDMLTGICLGWQDVAAIDLDQPLSWDGKASRLDVSLVSVAPDLGFHCTVQHVPDDEHWPIQDATNRLAAVQREGMSFKTTTGEQHSLYLPERSGQLKVSLGKLFIEFRVPPLPAEKVVVEIDQEGPRLRKE